MCFFIQALNHPFRKIYVDPLLFLSGAERFRQIGEILDIDIAIIEKPVQIFSFHIEPLQPFLLCVQI